ncbi:hypothetical protein CHARACLAT_030697 [Characodon lateralis]|uniref:Uncharacterized protein n=1 Tax=Characodon lateralis TaxID=208331 RepID=A0ABU7E846_9TELE|nr:hypothetical protein [Characodon lateralis]
MGWVFGWHEFVMVAEKRTLDKLLGKNKTNPLDEVKRKLENQKYQLTAKLEKVETERQKNKEDLQYVEKEITQRESLDGKDVISRERKAVTTSVETG